MLPIIYSSTREDVFEICNIRPTYETENRWPVAGSVNRPDIQLWKQWIKEWVCDRSGACLHRDVPCGVYKLACYLNSSLWKVAEMLTHVVTKGRKISRVIHAKIWFKSSLLDKLKSMEWELGKGDHNMEDEICGTCRTQGRTDLLSRSRLCHYSLVAPWFLWIVLVPCAGD
jgi:hypothetical protein